MRRTPSSRVWIAFLPFLENAEILIIYVMLPDYMYYSDTKILCTIVNFKMEILKDRLARDYNRQVPTT